MWEIKTLSEVCIIKPPKNEAKQKLAESDLVSFVPMNELGICTKSFKTKSSKPLSLVSGSYTYFADNDVLLAKITPCFENGKLGIARNLTNGIGFGSSEFVVLRSKGLIDPEFLFYFLSQDSFRKNGSRVMTGAVGHRRVPKEYIASHPIPVPTLPEQKSIVETLDKAFEGIDAAIANTQANLDSAREVFNSYLNHTFTKQGNGWVKDELQSICENITDGTHQTPKYFDTGFVFLSSKNVKTRSIDWDNIKYIDQAQHDAMQKRLSPRMGDILLAKNGTTGVAAIVDRDDIVFDIYVSLALLRSKGDVDPRYILHFVNSPVAKAQFNKRLKGVGVPNLHLKEIREVEIFYPKKVSEQLRIVAKIDELLKEAQRLEINYEQKLDALNELKQSILAKAFRGELTNKEIAA